MKRILYLCTANSARSIMAEAVTNRIGGARVRAWSAGSRPRGVVHPAALRLLAAEGHDLSALRSKGWEEFSAAGAPRFDAVITMCDAAAGETCPIWPGAPVRAHWGIPDPAAEGGNDEDFRFRAALARIWERVGALLALPFERMPMEALQDALARIGAESGGATARAGR